MVFYVYTDPQIISDAKEAGQAHLQILVAILKDFVENCFLIEFEDYRLQRDIEENVNSIPDQYFERKQIKTLLSTLQKRNRFVYCLLPDYTGRKKDLEIALENTKPLMIDLFLLKSTSHLNTPVISEVTDLLNYQNTQFAENRSKMMNVVYAGGEYNEGDFLNMHYMKALIYASRLEICDGIFGKKFAGNFEYTTNALLKWLENMHTNPKELIISFHCEKPDGKTDEHIKNRLAYFRRNRLSDTEIIIQFYESLDGSQCLPHDRYIITDQIAFDIGRGMDFLDRNTKKNRDTKIGIQNLAEIEKLIEKFKDFRLPEIKV